MQWTSPKIQLQKQTQPHWHIQQQPWQWMNNRSLCFHYLPWLFKAVNQIPCSTCGHVYDQEPRHQAKVRGIKFIWNMYKVQGHSCCCWMGEYVNHINVHIMCWQMCCLKQIWQCSFSNYFSRFVLMVTLCGSGILSQMWRIRCLLGIFCCQPT